MFDAPDRGVCTVRRDRSNTPLQALTLLNDRAFVEMMQAFAKSGKTALTLHTAADLPGLLETLLDVGLQRAAAEVGKHITNSDIPVIIGELSALWAQGRITNLDPNDVQFEKVFTGLVTQLAA